MMSLRSARALARALAISFLLCSGAANTSPAQTPLTGDGIVPAREASPAARLRPAEPTAPEVQRKEPRSTTYFDPVQGATSDDLVSRAIANNAELAAARLDIERARARLRQAGLRPNPAVGFEQGTGGLTGSAGEWETSIEFSIPIELGGKRRRRLDLARAELQAVEAEVADRERRLAAEVRIAYADAMTAVREIETIEGLNNVDVQTARIVEARVTEGESAPLDLNLLRVEVDRLRSRRALAEGRLQAALLRLKSLAGMPLGEALRLREDLAAPVSPEIPPSVDAAVDVALRTRPDLKLARLTEEVARAGLLLAQAEARPEVTAVGRYSFNRTITDLPAPLAPFPDRDHLVTFGISIGIPVFNRNQGAKAEAETAIAQARKRREFLESVVRAEVASAYTRYEAASSAVVTFGQGVLGRSMENIRSIRGAYEIGEFRVTELLVEQRRFVDSQREFIEALAERYRALADLQSAMALPIK